MDDRSETKHLLAGHLALHQSFNAAGGFCGICCSWGRQTANIQRLEPRLRKKKDFTAAPQHHCVEFLKTGTQWKKRHWLFTLFALQVHFPLADVQQYPEWVFGICVLLSVIPVVSIPLVALYKFMGFLEKYIMNRHNQNPYANELFQGEL